MRLRLHLERNALPATQALWPVKDRKCTIAQLLQHINEVFPLEGNTWGLEDYKVSVSGYECLHYQVLEDVLKEDEEVTVQPLQWVDVRARTVTGRNQISRDGRRMVDGVPFGRNVVTRPVRPHLVIPPRKRRRLLEESGIQGEQARAGQLLLMGNDEEVEGDDDDQEMDEDFEAEDIDHSSSAGSSPAAVDDSEADETSSSDTDSTSSSDDSSSDDSDDAPSIHTSKSVTTAAAPAAKTKALPSMPKKNGNTQSTSVIASNKRKREAPDEGHQVDTSHNSEATGPKSGARPSETQERNRRRRDSKKLKFLKNEGIMPANATMSDLREWQSIQSIQQNSQLSASGSHDAQAGPISSLSVAGNNNLQTETTNGETSAGAEATETPGTSVNVLKDSLEVSVSLSKRQKKKQKKAMRESDGMATESHRQQLLAAIEAGGIDVSETFETNRSKKNDISAQVASQMASEQASALSAVSDKVERTDEGEEQSTPTTTPRRSRINLASIQRLVCGSLGVRMPKTDEERERVQETLSHRQKRNMPALEGHEATMNSAQTNGESEHAESSTMAEEAQQGDHDPDAWKSKINLTAVECCEDDVTYPDPPFPFRQRWHISPYQYKKMHKAGKRSGSFMHKKGQKKTKAGEFYETYDKYNTNGDGDALDYDEAGDDDDDDEYWEDGALLGDDVTESEVEGDGFPPLPKQLDACPALPEELAQTNDFIAYTELACDETTGWEPLSVTRMAKIVDCKELDGKGTQWTLQMSNRDRKARFFDNEGNRVYGKFEMPDDEEDDEAGDDGVREVVWQALGDVKLVSKAGEVDNGDADAGDAVNGDASGGDG